MASSEARVHLARCRTRVRVTRGALDTAGMKEASQAIRLCFSTELDSCTRFHFNLIPTTNGLTGQAH